MQTLQKLSGPVLRPLFSRSPGQQKMISHSPTIKDAVHAIYRSWEDLTKLLISTFLKARDVKIDAIWKLDKNGYTVPSVTLYVAVTLVIACAVTFIVFDHYQEKQQQQYQQRQPVSATSVISGAVSSGSYHQTALSLINVMGSTPLVYNKRGTSVFIADDKVAVEVLSNKDMSKGAAYTSFRQRENVPDILTAADGKDYRTRFAGFGSALQELDVPSDEITGPLLHALSVATYSGALFDAAAYSTFLALDILCKAAFGEYCVCISCRCVAPYSKCI